jgi:hypothetical protein
MIIDIELKIKAKIDTADLPGLHAGLVLLRDATTSNSNKEQLNGIIEPLAQKLQYLEDRKLLIQDAKDSEEERVRLLRSASGFSASSTDTTTTS